MYQQISSKNKSDQVKDALYQLILDGALKPGDRLPSETALAEKFNVSRVTIREAIKELSVVGLAYSVHGEGTFIAEASMESYLTPVMSMLVLSDHNMDTLYEARKYIELGTVSLATVHATDENILELEEILLRSDPRKTTQQESDLAVQDVMDFHYKIAACCGNQVLLILFDALNKLILNGMSKTSKGEEGKVNTYKEHKRIFDQIKSRDVKAAQNAMIEHIESVHYKYQEIQTNEKSR